MYKTESSRYVSPVVEECTNIKHYFPGKHVDLQKGSSSANIITNARILHDISNHPNSCRHYPSGHWSSIARFFLNCLILSNFYTTVVYRVINIDDLDSLALFL